MDTLIKIMVLNGANQCGTRTHDFVWYPAPERRGDGVHSGHDEKQHADQLRGQVELEPGNRGRGKDELLLIFIVLVIIYI